MSIEVNTKSFPVELVVIPMIIIVLMAMALISPRQSPSPDLQQCVSELSEARSEKARIHGRLITCDRGRRQCLDIAEDSQACCLDVLNHSIRTLEQVQENLR